MYLDYSNYAPESFKLAYTEPALTADKRTLNPIEQSEKRTQRVVNQV